MNKFQDWEEGQYICDGGDEYVRYYYEMSYLICENENVLDRHWVIAVKRNAMIAKELSVVLCPTNTRVTFETFRTWLLQ